MKRINLVVDEELLETATRLLGAKTFSAAVDQALRETIQLWKIRGIADFVGSGIWQGDVPKMRKDKEKSKK